MSQICAITSRYCGNLLDTSTVRRATPPRVPTEKGQARHVIDDTRSLPASPANRSDHRRGHPDDLPRRAGHAGQPGPRQADPHRPGHPHVLQEQHRNLRRADEPRRQRLVDAGRGTTARLQERQSDVPGRPDAGQARARHQDHGQARSPRGGGQHPAAGHLQREQHEPELRTGQRRATATRGRTGRARTTRSRSGSRPISAPR